MKPAIASRLEQGWRHLRAGEIEAARALALRLVQQSPAEAAAHQLACVVLCAADQPRQAVYYGERACALAPDSGEMRCNLANCYALTEEDDKAIAAYRAGLAIRSDLTLAALGLAQLLKDHHQSDEAIALMRGVLGREPNHPKAARLLGTLLLDRSDQDEAVRVLRDAVADHPRDLELLSGYVSALNYQHGADPRVVRAAHEQFGEAQRLAVGAAPPIPFAGSRDPDRPLRVGILSSDFRVHSCASYMEPLVESLDRARVFVALYHNHANQDAVTGRFRELADLFRQVNRAPDAALAEQIARDRIDVLVECNGHTEGRRFGVMQRRPAPVQATYLGYPNTTGVRAIDVRLIDSTTDPPGPADGLAVERLVRLDPSFLCYRAPREAGEVAPSPCLANGFITLGSFNAAPKLTEPIMRLWSRLVREIAGCRLILKHFAMKDPGVRREIERKFGEAGMPAERLELLEPQAGRAHHLATYARIDLGLDPFPYHGTTTTCEAFHMGIPVVTLEGSVHAARVGVSLLRTVGLDELIARDEEHYVRIVKGLAADPARLAALRAGMRDRLLASPLSDGRAFAARFEAALRAEWRRWCAAGA